MRDEIPFRPAEAAETAATVFTCPLCGFKFAHGDEVCGCCPLAAGCDIVKCPHCGYSFPRSSRIAGWVQRLFGWTGGRHEPRP